MLYEQKFLMHIQTTMKNETTHIYKERQNGTKKIII